MPKLLQLSAEGSDVLIAVKAPGESLQAVGILDGSIEKLEKSMDDVFRMVGAVAASFAEQLRSSPVASAELEFGFQFTAKGTVYVVESEAQAALKLKLVFNQSPAETPQPS